MIGDLKEFSLSDLLQLIERGSKTGLLEVQAPKGIYRIWFYQSRVVTALSPESNQSLKQLLVEFGFASERVASKLASLSVLNEPLGSFLQKQGLICAIDLAKLFRHQLCVGLYELLSLEAGQFHFTANLPLPYAEMTGLSKGAVAAMMEGLRYLETVQKLDDRLPEPDSRFFRVSSELPLLKLSALEWSIWEQVSPDLKLHDLARLLRADLLEVRRACSRLQKIGLIDLYSEQDPAQKSEIIPENAISAISPLPQTSIPTPIPDSQNFTKIGETLKPTSPLPAKASQVPDKVSLSLLSRLADVLRRVH
ncbi:MAG: DUF4388 domain-containing protein [Cyanobacteriota bacterium]